MEAFQFKKAGYIPDWFIDELNAGRAWYQGGSEPYYTIEINGGKDTIKAFLGQWIVRNISAEINVSDKKPNI